MPQTRFFSPWAAGADSFLQSMAEREIEQERQLDKQRQQVVQDRDYDLRNRRQTLDERAFEAEGQATKVKADQAAAAQAQIQADIAAVSAPGPATPEKMQAGFRLDAAGVSPDMIQGVLNPQQPKPTTKPVVRVNPRTGKMETLGEVDANAHFVNEPAPPQGEKPFKATPAMVLAAKQQALRMAQAAFGPNAQPPAGYDTPEAYARALEHEFLGTLGIETPAPPTPAPPLATAGGRPMDASAMLGASDINLPAPGASASVSAPQKPQGPAPGTKRMIGGQLAEWDGKGWLPVRQ